MDDSTRIEFPPEVRSLLDQAVLALWDPARPVPDLSPITDWLEVDGWDHVVNGLVGPYLARESLCEILHDSALREDWDIGQKSRIRNADRIEYARSEIANRLADGMDTIACIPIDSPTMPPADLCMMVDYNHPQGGAQFPDLMVCHSIDDYLESLKGDIVMDADSLSDRDILRLWTKGDPAWMKLLKS